MRKKTEERTGGDAPTPTASRLSPAEVQNKEFGLSFRGYNERDVDEFLDRVTEDLSWYIDENRKLRSQLSSSGYVDPNEWGANAEAAAGEVLMRAKQEAERIVREAEARAAAIGTAGATDHRAIVAPYLNRERDFLQSLGGLVQEHAETIKAMVEEARRRAEAAPSPVVVPPAAEPEPEPERQTRPEPEATTASRDAGAEDVTGGTQASEPEPIVITDEEVEASEPSTAFDRRAVVASPGEAARREDDDERRSLRELFWGNE
jgi:cell division initiation protein